MTRHRTSMSPKPLLTFIGFVTVLFVYNEFLVYYLVLLQCSWPRLESGMLDLGVGSEHQGEVKALLLADTHLLGSREGHWFDKLRREWQMERSFQTALTLFSPDVIFLLGDVFDEGKWCSDTEFRYYVTRFNKMFRHPDNIQLEVIAGNHDIGFHYMVDEHKRRRFSSAFNAPSVRMVNIKDNIFVLLNSVAFEGDQCDMCAEAMTQLDEIVTELNCAQGSSDVNCVNRGGFKYTKPIILQHYPMYRESDKNCTGPDVAPPSEKYKAFKPKWDCLSKSASDMLFHRLRPRLVISGHTHHFCHRFHTDGTQEWTIASISWRNKPNPSFLLLTLNNNDYAISKCFVPQERTVINTYIYGGIFITLWFVVPKLCARRSSNRVHKVR